MHLHQATYVHPSMTAQNTPVIKSGKILTYRLYDVAFEIDLLKVEEKIKKETKRLKIKRKPFSKAFEFSNPPVSFQLREFTRTFNGFNFTINVYTRAYDYGVLSIILEIPINNMDFSSFGELALTLENTDDVDVECGIQLKTAISILGDSLINPNVSYFEEDYTIFFIESFSPEIAIDDLLNNYDIARLMLYEDNPLSKRVRDELMSWRFSYHENDCAILSWDSALIIEPTGETEITDILEFAHTQLLELRYYDHIVDREFESIYRRVSARGTPSVWNIKKYEKFAAKVMSTVAELTDITEKIDSSLKVTEDVYYAKIYMSAIRLFRVKEWEAGIRRKLDIASTVYDMLYREIATKRTELLEFVIIILIAIEIILFFVRE